MNPHASGQRLACDLQRHPQLAVIAIMRAATVATVPALLQAHPAVAADRLSTTTEVAADNVIRLAERLCCALDNYRRILLDADEF